MNTAFKNNIIIMCVCMCVCVCVCVCVMRVLCMLLTLLDSRNELSLFADTP